jgi:hypothetical protein
MVWTEFPGKAAFPVACLSRLSMSAEENPQDNPGVRVSPYFYWQKNTYSLVLQVWGSVVEN